METLESAARDCHRTLQGRTAVSRAKSEVDAVRFLQSALHNPADRDSGVRVAGIAERIGERFSLPDEDRMALYWAGRCHRLCRLAIPAAILDKPGPLTRLEAAIVRLAPSEVFEVLLEHPFLASAGYLLRSIGEREDGRGYPDGLAGPAIPLGSRILSVAVAVEAITRDQPHRRARSPLDAVLELLRCAGTQFDAGVVRVAVEVAGLSRGQAA